MPDESEALPTWVIEFTKQYGITQPVHSLEELTDALLTHFEQRGHQLQREEAKLLSHLVSACTHSLRHSGSTSNHLNALRLLNCATSSLINLQNRPQALHADPNTDEMYVVEDVAARTYHLSDLLVDIRMLRRRYQRDAGVLETNKAAKSND